MAIALSQFVSGTAGGVSSVNVLFSSAVTAGNSIMLAAGYFASGGGAPFSTLVDPVNAAGYASRIHSTMSNAADAQAHLVMHDKLNFSSGRAASTYRISLNASAAAGLTLCAMEWAGGPFTSGSTAVANGTSTGPLAGAVTASSTPAVFVCAAINNSTATFNSTVGAGGPAKYLTTVDPTNANQVLNVIYSLNSSLQQNPMHSMNTSTRWLAGVVVYMGAGGGGAVATGSPWQMAMMGIQDKVY
jgi:hypothetical protein